MARVAKKCLLLALVLCLLIPAVALAADPVEETINVTNAAELKVALHDRVKAIGSTGVYTKLTVNIKNDIDMGSVSWEAQKIQHNLFVVVNGNNHTITGLQNMLFAGSWAGKSGLEVSDLTLSEANIVFNPDDNPETDGVGAFIGAPSASTYHITLENCSLIDSHVEGGHWTGGLIGWTAGYSGDDGPVFMEVNITNCSILGNTIVGKGSVGGVIGHGLADPWTGVTITNTSVMDNTITSTGSSAEKAGDFVGTIGTAGYSAQPVGKDKKTGYLRLENVTAIGNTTTSNGTEVERFYGRPGDSTRDVIVDVVGGMFDMYETEQQNGNAKLNINKTNDPIFKENICIVIFKDGANGEIFADDKWYCGKGEPTPVLDAPTRAGYTFAGWSPALAATVTGDATYTATWTAIGNANPAAPAAPAAPAPAAPKTGDNTPIAMLSMVVLASAAAVVWLVSSKRKANQQ